VTAAQNDNSIVIYGSAPNRILKLAASSNGECDTIPQNIWTDLLNCLQEVHPIAKTGKKGFAEYLRSKGPPSIRNLPFTKVLQLVRTATGRGILARQQKMVCSVEINVPVKKTNNTAKKPLDDATFSKITAEVVKFVAKCNGRSQIGAVSSYLDRRGFIRYLKERGGVKSCLEEMSAFEFEHDGNNGLYVVLKVLKDASIKQEIFDFIRSYQGRMQIGTLGEYLRKKGTLDKLRPLGGLKEYLKASGCFAIEQEKSSVYVRISGDQRTNDIQQGEETDSSDDLDFDQLREEFVQATEDCKSNGDATGEAAANNILLSSSPWSPSAFDSSTNAVDLCQHLIQRNVSHSFPEEVIMWNYG
jgi:hypothetical protein